MHRIKTKVLAFAMAGSMALSMSGMVQPITAMAAGTETIESTITQTALESVSLDIPRPTFGNTITANVVPEDADVTYQWYNSNGKIEGATEKSYKPTEEDVMKQLRVYVKGTGDYTGTVTVRTAAPVQREAITGVTLDIPRPTFGDTVTAVTIPEDANATYQWYNSDGKIEGATDKSYTPTSEDVMKHLRVYVKGTGAYTGSVTVRTTAPVQRNTITGVSLDIPRPTYGDTLTAVTVPEDAEATYQWYNSDGIIEGATDKTYTPTAEDVMKHIRVYVKGSGAYNGSVTVRTTAPVQRAAITGVSLDIPRPTYGDTITAVTVPEDADATYQWYNSDGKIEGATGKSYTPTSDDIMKHLRVYVKGANGYTGSVTVRTTAPVQRGDYKELIAKGTLGTCSWKIDGNGKLTIYPTDGVSGSLGVDLKENEVDDEANGVYDFPGGGNRWPWNAWTITDNTEVYTEESLASAITSVYVAPGVKTGTSCEEMFAGLDNATSIDVSNLDTSDAINMAQMFAHNPSLTELNLGDMDTSSVKNMCLMFWGVPELESIDLSSFDTSNVVNMRGMFTSDYALKSIDFSNKDVSNVRSVSEIFFWCTGLESVDLTNCKFDSLEDANWFFSQCESLTEIKTEGMKADKISQMWCMFTKCELLEEIDLTWIDTRNVDSVNTSFMLSECTNLKKVYVSDKWDNNVEKYRADLYGRLKDHALSDTFWHTYGLTSADGSTVCDGETNISSDYLNYDNGGYLTLVDSEEDAAITPFLGTWYSQVGSAQYIIHEDGTFEAHYLNYPEGDTTAEWTLSEDGSKLTIFGTDYSFDEFGNLVDKEWNALGVGYAQRILTRIPSIMNYMWRSDDSFGEDGYEILEDQGIAISFSKYDYGKTYSIDQDGYITFFDSDSTDVYQYNMEDNTIVVTHEDGSETILHNWYDDRIM